MSFRNLLRGCGGGVAGYGEKSELWRGGMHGKLFQDAAALFTSCTCNEDSFSRRHNTQAFPKDQPSTNLGKFDEKAVDVYN